MSKSKQGDQKRENFEFLIQDDLKKKINKLNINNVNININFDNKAKLDDQNNNKHLSRA